MKILTDKKELASLVASRSASTSAAKAEEIALEIIENIRSNGDAALFAYSEKLDGVKLGADLPVRVSQAEIDAAYESIGNFAETLRRCADNIRAFHSMQLRKGFEIKGDGYLLGQRFLPISRVGIYVPGGTASYPSTVLMNAIPAKLAGVPELVMVTPPGRDGKIRPEILAAAKIAGVDEVYRVGGAHAIAALAYGTESIKKADKITGPGNIYVAAAKKCVSGQVAVDMIAGPSEILIIADETANPAFVAADLLGQAEHDRLAAPLLVCFEQDFADKVSAELDKQLASLPRREIAGAAVEANGAVYIAKDRSDAAEAADMIAAEHLEICCSEPEALMAQIRNAGSIFLGNYSPEALGDYFAGPNHTLPTMGTARFSSPLSVDDFVKKNSYIKYEKYALIGAADDIIEFAQREGLNAHAASVAIRKENGK